MWYDSLNNLVVLPKKKGDGKFNAWEYVDVIIDRELFNKSVKGTEELGDIIIMEDGAGYHQGVATKRRKQYLMNGPYLQYL